MMTCTEDMDALIEPEQDESYSRLQYEQISSCNFQSQNELHVSLLAKKVPSWVFLLYAVLVGLLSMLLLVILPIYIENVNKSGDVYSAVVFVFVFTLLPLVIYIKTQHACCSLYGQLRLCSSASVFKYGLLYGLGIIGIAYSLDRKRVLCHSQEPMMGLILIYMIIIYFFYKGPGLTAIQMFCLCGVFGGAFLSMDFQLNNIYHCHGKTRSGPEDDGGTWTSEEHALWTIIYALSLFLFTLSWLLMHQEITLLTFSEPVSNFEGNSLDQVNSLQLRWDIHLAWFLSGSLVTILALFWTDVFTPLGKAGSPDAFPNLFLNTVKCHFQMNEECRSVALYGWIFIVLHNLLLFIMGKLVQISGSILYTLAVSSVSLPLSSLWWTLFQNGGTWGLQWNPRFSGELIFSLFGIPLMVFCLSYWAHTICRKVKCTGNFPLSCDDTIDV